jgi:hypothetical protein
MIGPLASLEKTTIMSRLRPYLLAVVCACMLMLGALPLLALSAAQDDEPNCVNGWASLPSAAFPGKIKVWATCTGAYEEDLREMLGIAERLWGPMTEFMGIEPLPDEGTASAGGDTAIDFYLADQETGVPQRGSGPPAARSFGYSRAAAPFVGAANSAFVVMRREMLGDAQFTKTLAHEFFHVLQQARNAKLTFNWDIRPDDDPEWDTLVYAEQWWTEATAEWAAFHFTRDMPQLDDLRLVAHQARFSYFLENAAVIPLHAPQQRGESGWAFMYSTYIWFYFMEQEIGPQAIAEIWEAFGRLNPGTIDQAKAIIDAQLPFAEHFRDFTVRNLNLDLEPGDPIDPDYDDLDPQFPVGDVTAPLLVGAEDAEAWLPIAAGDEEPRRFADRLRSLTAHYYRFLLDPRGDMLTLDFSDLAPVGDLDVDTLVKIDGGAWERRQLEPGGAVTLCLSEPEDDVEELYLVLSNHNRDLFSIVEGEFTAQVVAGACGEET